METLSLKIVSPFGALYNKQEVVKVTIPTAAGEVTIHPRHIPLVSSLAPGEIVVHEASGQTSLAVSEGILRVEEGSQVHIMADTAEHAKEIDVERSERAKQRAEELLAQQHNIDDVEFAKIQAKIEKELARLGVARKYTV